MYNYEGSRNVRTMVYNRMQRVFDRLFATFPIFHRNAVCVNLIKPLELGQRDVVDSCLELRIEERTPEGRRLAAERRVRELLIFGKKLI